MGRFIKREAFEKKFENDLVSIDCSANNQLPDSDIAIGEGTKKALAQLKPEHRKNVLLSIHFTAHKLPIYSFIYLFRTFS